MSRYLTFNQSGFGFQIIARGSFNQTFEFYHIFNGICEALEGRFQTGFKSDLNYQLAVL